MVISQNNGLIWMSFLEEVIAGLSKDKHRKISWTVHQNYCQILVLWSMKKLLRNQDAL